MPFRRILANISDLIQGADRLILDADATAGQSTLTVQNIVSVSTNSLLFIGDPGNERSEIIATHASTAPSGTTVTLAAALTQPHPAGTVAYIVRANKVHFYQSAAQVDANVDASSLVSLAAAQSIDPTSINNHFDDPSSTSGYYYYRFEDSVNSVNLNYSSGIPWQEQQPEYAQNQVGYLLEKARRKIGFDWGDKFSKQDAFDEINDCFDYIDGAQLRWPRHFVANYVLGQLTMGGYEFTVPTNIYDGKTNRSILQIRIAGQVQPLTYRDEKEFDNLMAQALVTTVRTQPLVGATSLNVVDSDNFGTAGTVHAFTGNADDAITFTGNTVSPTVGILTGVPATGDGSIATAHPVGTNVWLSPSQGQPWWFTVRNGKIAIWPLASSEFVNFDIFLDYYTVATRVQFESDTLDEDRYDMVKHWLLWKAKNYTRNNGKDDLQDADYLQFKDVLALAVKFKRPGQKFKWKPKINSINYPGRFSNRTDEGKW